MFKEDAAMEQDLEMLKAMVYILYTMKIHILSLEDPTVATGSMVHQVLEGLMSLLQLLSRGATHLNSGELHKTSVLESKISLESLTVVNSHSKIRMKVIALLLMEALKSRLNHATIILYLQLSFFDPLWSAQHHVSWVARQCAPT